MGITNLILSAVATLTEPALVDGQVSPLTVNADGRLRIASKPGLFPITTGALTTVASQLAVDVTDASNVVFHVKNTGSVTMAAGTFVFEGSVDSTNGIDGTWFGIQAVRSNANTIEVQAAALALVAGAGTLYAWEASVNATRWVRIRTTVAVTASAIATWSIVRGSYATEPIPAIQAHPVTGSGTFLVSPSTTVGYALVTAASTNAALIITGSKILTELTVANLTAAIIYVKLYNKATAPVPGTDIPLVTIPIPIGGFFEADFGSMGKRFALGLGIAVTGAAAATDTTAVAVGAQISATYI